MTRKPPEIPISSDDERTFLPQVREGNESAFAQMYKSYFETLWRFAYSYLKSSDLAEEVVQDVFLTIWTNRTEWCIQTTVRAYLFGAVRNRALKLLAHDTVTQRFARHVMQQDTSYGPIDQTTPADIQLESDDLDRRVARTILSLPERQRIAMTLRLKGMSYAEIASTLQISIAAVGKLIEKAQAKIRKIDLGG